MKIAMLDVETLALAPNAVVTQIALLPWDLAIGRPLVQETFVWWPQLEEQSDRVMSTDTVMWWMQQSAAARYAVSRPANGHRTKATEIFDNIRHIMPKLGIETVWAKPAMFDMPVLRSYFKECAYQEPWSHRIECDMQTLVQLYDPKGELKPESDADSQHDAAYDAHWQCRYLQALYNKARNFTP